MARNLILGAAALSAILLAAPAFANTSTVTVGEVFNTSNAGGNIGPGLFDQDFKLTVAGNGELDGSITVSSGYQPTGATFDLYAGSVSLANLLVSSTYTAYGPTFGTAGWSYLSAVTGVSYIAVFQGDVSHQVSSAASFSLTPPVRRAFLNCRPGPCSAWASSASASSAPASATRPASPRKF